MNELKEKNKAIESQLNEVLEMLSQFQGLHSDIPNNNISLTSSLLSNPDSLNIATHNVISFNDPVKQEQIIQNCVLNNIDITGISETNLPNDQLRHINKSLDKTFTYFFNSACSKCRGNGVRILINSSLASHIFYHHG